MQHSPSKLAKPQTLYLQLADELRARILDGVYAPNDLLPSEATMIATYGVSRITVRQAIALLVEEGIVQRIQGKGTIVQALKVEQNFLGLHDFARDLTRQGHKPSFKILEYARTEPTEHFRELFSLTKGEQVHAILRLKLSDDQPIMLERLALPSNIFPQLDEKKLRTQWISQILSETYGVSLRKVRKTLQPVVIGQTESTCLNVAPRSLGLLVDRITWDLSKSESPILVTRSIVPAEHSRFFVDLEYEQAKLDY